MLTATNKLLVLLSMLERVGDVRHDNRELVRPLPIGFLVLMEIGRGEKCGTWK